MSRARLLSAPALGVVTALFALSAVVSGQLIEERGGALGALEWLARTGVVVFGALALVGWFVAVLRLRRRTRRRATGWLLAGAVAAVFAWLAAVPVVYAVYLSHLPTRRAVHDADLGAAKLDVELQTRDGLRIGGWYVPSRNGAAVIGLHGTGSNRVGLADHARLLARHGYGVLLLDLRGHGRSDGRSTSSTWSSDADVEAAVAWLRRRPEVDPRRIAALGVSMGAQIALQAAAEEPGIAAVVAEGADYRTFGDARAAGMDPVSAVQLTGVFALARVLVGTGAPTPLSDLVPRIAPRPLLLISGGASLEAAANRRNARRGGPTTSLWVLPNGPHGAALRTDPRGYERRVVGFLDRALT